MYCFQSFNKNETAEFAWEFNVFLPDTAIKSINEDKLGRSNFATKLAETLRDWDRDESMVIALYGSWGIGKTSILNMTVEHIKKSTVELDEENRPIIIRFNPWNFSSQNQILGMFFSQLLADIEKGVPKVARELRSKLARYGQIVGTFSSVPLVGGLIGTTGELLQLLDVDQGTVELRHEINQLFMEINRRVIIVMDDLDRLTQAELRLVFQLIKLNADFPNTIYLIAADRTIIEKSLDTEQGISGREYLKKIVQVGFDVPPIDPAHITGFLFSELENVVSQANAKHWNEIDFANLYYTNLKSLFITFRDVKRFINGLTFNLRMVSTEVNALDFVYLEILRIFMPEIYRSIISYKFAFVTASFGERVDGEKLKSQYDKIFAMVDSKSEIAKSICIALFPNIGHVFFFFSYGPEWQPTWSTQSRICAEDKFDTYFLLEVSSGEISQVELDHVEAVSENRTEMRDALEKIIGTGRYARLLERLDVILDNLSDIGLRNFCILLFEFGDKYEDERRQALGPGTQQMVVFLINAALAKFEPDNRCQWLQEHARSTPIFTSFLDFVSYYDHINERDSQSLPISQECLAELKAICIQKIVGKFEANELEQVENLDFVLSLWHKWSPDTTQLDEFVRNMVETPISALTFVSGFLSKGSSGGFGDPIWPSYWRLDFEDLASYVDLDALDRLLSDITEEQAKAQSERHHAALETYRKIREKQQQDAGVAPQHD